MRSSCKKSTKKKTRLHINFMTIYKIYRKSFAAKKCDTAWTKAITKAAIIFFRELDFFIRERKLCDFIIKLCGTSSFERIFLTANSVLNLRFSKHLSSSHCNLSSWKVPKQLYILDVLSELKENCKNLRKVLNFLFFKKSSVSSRTIEREGLLENH